MPERRATRLLVEVLFLVALAAALTFAHVRPLVVVGVMALGWLLAALFEWASLLGQPHYGRGLPPRYFVPQTALPPSLRVERPLDVFPVAQSAGEGPTWIVPAGELNDWPWLREDEQYGFAEETQVVEVAEVVEAATVVARSTEPEPAPRPQPVRVSSAAASVGRARHRIDPFGSQPGGRRRRQDDSAGVVEVPARPAQRVLPGTARRGED
jgi:hypothetical protein